MNSYRKDGSPMRCPVCKSTSLSEEVKAVDGGQASEVLVTCDDCGKEVGFYGYGAWDPNFMRELDK